MSESVASSENPCLTCGACCATYRVSFYWAESTANQIPESMTEQVNSWYSCMSGTNQIPSRCTALEGEIGQHVGCSIYLQRPSPCHELLAGDEKCHKARMKYGLPPLISPEQIILQSPVSIQSPPPTMPNDPLVVPLFLSEEQSISHFH